MFESGVGIDSGSTVFGGADQALRCAGDASIDQIGRAFRGADLRRRRKREMEGKKRRRDAPVVLPDADAGVGGAEVDADGGTVNLSHDVLLCLSKGVWVANGGGRSRV